MSNQRSQLRNETMKKRILVVEDEALLAMTLADRLTDDGYVVETVSDGNAGTSRAKDEAFDLIILDIMLPGKSGFDVCRDLRQSKIDTPILMLTARGQVTDRVVGLKLGADDYLCKPFQMIELLARVEALLRRRHDAASGPDIYQFGTTRVDFNRAQVTVNGRDVYLSALEFKLLRHLIEQRGIVLSRDELLNKVWGYDATPSTRTVDVHVSSLRQKLETDPRQPELILTIHGLGYKFNG